MRTLYVGGLSPDTTAEKLQELFARFGTICQARVVMRAATGSCRGFGYVTFDSDRHAVSAMESLDGHMVRGNKLRVDLVR